MAPTDDPLVSRISQMIGRRVRVARLAVLVSGKPLSVAAAARAAKVDRRAWRRLENGDENAPTLPTLVRAMRALLVAGGKARPSEREVWERVAALVAPPEK